MKNREVQRTLTITFLLLICSSLTASPTCEIIITSATENFRFDHSKSRSGNKQEMVYNYSALRRGQSFLF